MDECSPTGAHLKDLLPRVLQLEVVGPLRGGTHERSLSYGEPCLQSQSLCFLDLVSALCSTTYSGYDVMLPPERPYTPSDLELESAGAQAAQTVSLY